MQPTKEWLEVYEQKRVFLSCPADLNAYFTADAIVGKKLDRLSIGTVSLPSGQVIVCDPLVFLSERSEPFFLSVPPGEYEVVLAAVTPDDDDCARYAAARVRFSDAETVRYKEALIGDENLLDFDGDYFGFGVDAGLACICDAQTRDAYAIFEKDWQAKAGRGANLYDDYFADLFSESYEKYPQYQREGGDWLNWQIPGTNWHIPIFASGFGDGVYPVFFGCDVEGNICSLVVHLINIGQEYAN
ncbi:MAG: DUF4241 domain-containing protein [Synergistaceae bacterium]|jgi:hypothetical protein|nr:DUF4241 domain-containing protein [Synergistaceae bacterium]